MVLGKSLGTRRLLQSDGVIGSIKPAYWLLLMMTGYFAIMSYVVLLRYYAFQTHAFDLGIFNQAFTTALQGKLFIETPDRLAVASGSFFGVHFNLLMYLILPVYAAFPFPQTLLILQTIFVALGAVPIYLVARFVIRNERIGLFMALAYLINPAIINLNFYDFHLEAFLPFFLGMFFYSYLVANWRGFSAFLVLSLITIDFASVLVLAISVAHLLRTITRSGGSWRHLRFEIDGLRARVLLLTVGISLVTLYLMLYLTVHFSGNNVSVAGSLSGFVSSFGGTQAFLLKSEFWMLCLIPLMFLPVLVPSQLAMVAPWFVVTVLAAQYATSYSFGYQLAGAFVVPYLILASIFAVDKLRKRRIDLRVLFACIIVFSLVISPLDPLAQYKLPGIDYQQGLPSVTPHDNILDAAISLIPANASVLTQNNLFPQVSSRADAYLFAPTSNASFQYVLADVSSETYVAGETGALSMKQLLPYYMANKSYGILVNDDGVILLEQGYSGRVVIAGPTTFSYNYQTLSLRSGSEETDSTSVSGIIFVHDASAANGSTFWFGPYVSLPPGQYSVSFVMKTAQATMGSIYLEVDDFENATTIPILAEARITQTNFTTPGSWENITLSFVLSPYQSANGRLEFRGVDVDGGPFSLDYVRVTYLTPFG